MTKCMVFLVFLVLPSVSVLAQDAQQDTIITYNVDEVVVTGTRVEKKIIDIPYSVQRIDNTQYKFDRKVAVNDVLSFVPGMFLQSRYGNHDVRISIRGFGSRSNTGIRGVRILLDGIPESEPDGQTRIEAIDFNSVGSIEIVKGNSSSLYTNAPGGVVNFINDIRFPSTSVTLFRDEGSFGLSQTGLKAAVKTDDSRFLLTYNYHNYKGYRAHSEDYWHILNTVYETYPGRGTNFQVLGYFVDGLIRLPGSLTKEQYQQDPLQPQRREVDLDFRRISKKGRVGLRFITDLDEARDNLLEVTTYGTIKYFERTARTYRIINRYGLGASARYVNRTYLGTLRNEFSIGGDALYQTGPVEEYDNIGGMKGDNIQYSIDETIGNVGAYISNTLTLVPSTLSLLLTARHDKVVFDQRYLTLESRSGYRRFEKITPKAALNYKLTPTIALYTSYGLSFDSPAGNELDNPPNSSNQGSTLVNPDLQAQKSLNAELGIKGNVVFGRSALLTHVFFEGTAFNSVITDEIVPFEVNSTVYFRNSAKTHRMGLELGFELGVNPGFKSQVSYTLSDFTYREYLAIVYGPAPGYQLQDAQDFSGNIVPSVPKHNLTAAISHEYPWHEMVTSFIKLQVQSVSGLYVNDQNSDKTEGYTIFGASGGVDVNLHTLHILVSGGVSNIFDKRYVGFININSANGQFYEAGEPRSYFVGIRVGLSPG